MLFLISGVSTSAVARWGNRFHDNGFNGRGWYGSSYHYPHMWGGFYIGPQWFGGPTIVIDETPYYYYNGSYYTPQGDYLIAVAPPQAPTTQAEVPSAAPANAQLKADPKNTKPTGDTATINVPNKTGGFTPVKLVKTEKGYIGPQGEFYPEHPTIAELKVLYGN